VSVPVVYDTMVFLQAATSANRIHATMQAIKNGRVTLCISLDLLAEVRDVLNRDGVRRKFPALSAESVDFFIEDILQSGTMFDPVHRTFGWPQHTDDDHIFNLAIHAKAKYLVTWENRILKLPKQTTPAADLLRKLAPALEIITPKQLADAIRIP